MVHGRAGQVLREETISNLVLEEAVVNIINYAYPKEEHETIYLSAKMHEGSIVFVLTDTGKEFDPTELPVAYVTLSADDRQIRTGRLSEGRIPSLLPSVSGEEVRP